MNLHIMNLHIRCHYKNSAWATNGRGTAIITLNSYRADHQSPVVIVAYRPYRLKKKVCVSYSRADESCISR